MNTVEIEYVLYWEADSLMWNVIYPKVQTDLDFWLTWHIHSKNFDFGRVRQSLVSLI